MRLLTAPVLHQVQLRYDVLSDVGTGRPVGLRAGVVWVHPTWGDLPADDAWSAAERAGLQGVLRGWQLTQACRDAAGFPDAVDVAVALPAQLTPDGTFADDVADALAVAGLPPARLLLCCPRALLQHRAVLRAVHDTGVRLALTHHGAGTTLPEPLAEVPLAAVVTDVGTPDELSRVGALGLPVMTGLPRPGGLTAAEAAALLAPQPV